MANRNYINPDDAFSKQTSGTIFYREGRLNDFPQAQDGIFESWKYNFDAGKQVFRAMSEGIPGKLWEKRLVKDINGNPQWTGWMEIPEAEIHGIQAIAVNDRPLQLPNSDGAIKLQITPSIIDTFSKREIYELIDRKIQDNSDKAYTYVPWIREPGPQPDDERPWAENARRVLEITFPDGGFTETFYLVEPKPGVIGHGDEYNTATYWIYDLTQQPNLREDWIRVEATDMRAYVTYPVFDNHLKDKEFHLESSAERDKWNENIEKLDAFVDRYEEEKIERNEDIDAHIDDVNTDKFIPALDGDGNPILDIDGVATYIINPEYNAVSMHISPEERELIWKHENSIKPFPTDQKRYDVKDGNYSESLTQVSIVAPVTKPLFEKSGLSLRNGQTLVTNLKNNLDILRQTDELNYDQHEIQYFTLSWRGVNTNKTIVNFLTNDLANSEDFGINVTTETPRGSWVFGPKMPGNVLSNLPENFDINKCGGGKTFNDIKVILQDPSRTVLFSEVSLTVTYIPNQYVEVGVPAYPINLRGPENAKPMYNGVPIDTVGGAGGGKWGSIIGNLEDQSDLNAYLEQLFYQKIDGAGNNSHLRYDIYRNSLVPSLIQQDVATGDYDEAVASNYIGVFTIRPEHFAAEKCTNKEHILVPDINNMEHPDNVYKTDDNGNYIDDDGNPLNEGDKPIVLEWGLKEDSDACEDRDCIISRSTILRKANIGDTIVQGVQDAVNKLKEQKKTPFEYRLKIDYISSHNNAVYFETDNQLISPSPAEASSDFEWNWPGPTFKEFDKIKLRGHGVEFLSGVRLEIYWMKYGDVTADANGYDWTQKAKDYILEATGNITLNAPDGDLSLNAATLTLRNYEQLNISAENLNLNTLDFVYKNGLLSPIPCRYLEDGDDFDYTIPSSIYVPPGESRRRTFKVVKDEFVHEEHPNYICPGCISCTTTHTEYDAIKLIDFDDRGYPVDINGKRISKDADGNYVLNVELDEHNDPVQDHNGDPKLVPYRSLDIKVYGQEIDKRYASRERFEVATHRLETIYEEYSEDLKRQENKFDTLNAERVSDIERVEEERIEEDERLASLIKNNYEELNERGLATDEALAADIKNLADNYYTKEEVYTKEESDDNYYNKSETLTIADIEDLIKNQTREVFDIVIKDANHFKDLYDAEKNPVNLFENAERVLFKKGEYDLTGFNRTINFSKIKYIKGEEPVNFSAPDAMCVRESARNTYFETIIMEINKFGHHSYFKADFNGDRFKTVKIATTTDNPDFEVELDKYQSIYRLQLNDDAGIDNLGLNPTTFNGFDADVTFTGIENGRTYTFMIDQGNTVRKFCIRNRLHNAWHLNTLEELDNTSPNTRTVIIATGFTENDELGLVINSVIPRVESRTKRGGIKLIVGNLRAQIHRSPTTDVAVWIRGLKTGDEYGNAVAGGAIVIETQFTNGQGVRGGFKTVPTGVYDTPDPIRDGHFIETMKEVPIITGWTHNHEAGYDFRIYSKNNPGHTEFTGKVGKKEIFTLPSGGLADDDFYIIDFNVLPHFYNIELDPDIAERELKVNDISYKHVDRLVNFEDNNGIPINYQFYYQTCHLEIHMSDNPLPTGVGWHIYNMENDIGLKNPHSFAWAFKALEAPLTDPNPITNTYKIRIIPHYYRRIYDITFLNIIGNPRQDTQFLVYDSEEPWYNYIEFTTIPARHISQVDGYFYDEQNIPIDPISIVDFDTNIMSVEIIENHLTIILKGLPPSISGRYPIQFTSLTASGYNKIWHHEGIHYIANSGIKIVGDFRYSDKLNDPDFNPNAVDSDGNLIHDPSTWKYNITQESWAINIGGKEIDGYLLRKGPAEDVDYHAKIQWAKLPTYQPGTWEIVTGKDTVASVKLHPLVEPNETGSDRCIITIKSIGIFTLKFTSAFDHNKTAIETFQVWVHPAHGLIVSQNTMDTDDMDTLKMEWYDSVTNARIISASEMSRTEGKWEIIAGSTSEADDFDADGVPIDIIDKAYIDPNNGRLWISNKAINAPSQGNGDVITIKFTSMDQTFNPERPMLSPTQPGDQGRAVVAEKNITILRGLYRLLFVYKNDPNVKGIHQIPLDSRQRADQPLEATLVFTNGYTASDWTVNEIMKLPEANLITRADGVTRFSFNMPYNHTELNIKAKRM